MNKTLNLKPIKGKFTQITLDGVTYDIFRYHPALNTDENNPIEGTPIPYESAVKLLSLSNPIVTLVPKIKDGKYVEQLEEVDAASMANAHKLGDLGVAITNNSVSENTDAVAMAKVVSAQATTIQAMAEQLKAATEAAEKANEAAQKALEAVAAMEESGKDSEDLKDSEGLKDSEE